MQRLPPSAVWNENGVRDELRGYVLKHFADPGAVLVVDETGDLKLAMTDAMGLEQLLDFLARWVKAEHNCLAPSPGPLTRH